ncbi:response regulator transcription factor [Mitsuaria sp. GD03876]|uniref:response regulator transcription factor n=1 Tax=Mitsuaria sp. GD03876 TaxID=2975399 RepID=UPI00244A27D0|nr:response regulator transcription factor [Mitsuaria sp. GD03876]MDH0866141.1 response regulator transcription factor [Mitsuaria sp. GD03876]
MNLLLAEDDAILADALCEQMRASGFTVEHAPNGAVAQYLLAKQQFEVVVLDLGLPMVGGLEVLRQLRQTDASLPVLILTALDSLEDRVAGLNAGADDYLTKPFDFPELEARLRALLRRSRASKASTELGQLSMQRETRSAQVRGEMLELSPREFDLLDLLLTHQGRVITKEQINQAWSGDRSGAGIADGGAATNAVEVYIHRLRRKLEGAQVAIRTVRGLGYLLELERA